MAVTLTVAQLSAAIRLGDTAEETEQATRLLAVGTQLVQDHLGSAFSETPESLVNEAVIRICGFLYDQPHVARGTAISNAGRSSGAWRLLLKYRLIGAGTTGEAVAAAASSGTTENPVTGIAVVGSDLTVSYADGTTNTEALPAGGTLGLREVGSDTVTVSTADTWTATTLVVPASSVAGASILYPNGDESAIFLVRTAVFDGTATPGEVVALDQRFKFNTAGDGTVLFAAPEVGDYTVRFFEVAEAPAGNGSSERTEAEVRDLAREVVADEYETGNTDLIPADKYRAPTSTARGAPYAVTNAIVDDNSHVVSTLYAWSRGHVLRLIQRVVPLWARDATTAVPVAKLPTPPTPPVTWAEDGNNDFVPSAKLPNATGSERGVGFAADQGVADGSGNAVVNARAMLWSRDLLVQLIGLLAPAARLLPDPSSLQDGVIAKVASGAWTVGNDEVGTGGGASAVPVELGNFSPTADISDLLLHGTGFAAVPAAAVEVTFSYWEEVGQDPRELFSVTFPAAEFRLLQSSAVGASIVGNAAAQFTWHPHATAPRLHIARASNNVPLIGRDQQNFPTHATLTAIAK